MSTPWYELWTRAAELPAGRERADAFARATEAAEPTDDVDALFECRIATVGASRNTDRIPEAAGELLLCARDLEDDPDRFAEFRPAFHGALEWLPGAARRNPEVPLERIETLIGLRDDVHAEAGHGPRIGLGERLELALAGGIGEPVEELLDRWCAAPIPEGIGCRCCDLDLEMRAQLHLGRTDRALDALDQLLRGRITPCAESLPSVGAHAIEPLLGADRGGHAGELFRLALGTARRTRDVPALAHLAALSARTGDLVGARRIRPSIEDRLDGLDPRRRLLTLARTARASTDDPSTSRRLAERAAELAARFDARDGTDATSRLVDAIVTAGDLQSAPLRRGPKPVPPDPDRVLADIDPLDSAPPPPSTDPIPPAPTGEGPLAVHHWSRERMDSWRPDVVRDSLRPVWFDPSIDVAVRATAGLWLGAAGERLTADELEIALDTAGEGLPTAVHANLLAETARRHGSARPERTRDLAARSLDLVDQGGLDDRDAVTVARTAAIALAAAEDPEGVLRGLGLVRINDPGPASGRVAAVLAALSAVEVADRGVVDSTDPEPVARLRSAVDRLVEAAEALLARRNDPLAVHALGQAARRRMRLGDPGRASAHVRLAVDNVPPGPVTSALRADLHLVQADAALRSDGDAAALAAQRAAIEAATESGSDLLAGWSRRGLAHRLFALGRVDDGVVQADEAIDRLERAGRGGTDVLRLRIAVARATRRIGRIDDAGEEAETVLLALERGEVTGPVADDLTVQALDVAGEVAFVEGADDRAHRLLDRLADLLRAADRPAAIARANAARAAARGGLTDRAAELLDEAELDLRVLGGANGPDEAERIRAEVVVLARRAEIASWAGDHRSAVDLAIRVRDRSRSLDDRRLEIRALALVARTRHDLATAASTDDEDLLTLVDEAEDALVEAVQATRAVGEDAAAEELAERLTALRDRFS